MLSQTQRVFSGGAAILLALAACNAKTPPVPVTEVFEAPPTVTRAPPTVTPQPTVPPTPTAIVINVTATPSPTPLPKPIVVALPGTPESLHPFYGTSPAAQAVIGGLFVGCVGVGPDERPQALGCERVPSAENGDAVFVGDGLDRHLELTFRIRPDWRWTDGTPVTAQDAVFAWKTIMSPESLLRDPLTQKVFSMSAPDGPNGRAVLVKFMSAAQAQAVAKRQLRGDVPFEFFSDLGDYDDYAKQTTPLADRDYWAVLRWLPAHLLSSVPVRAQRASEFASAPVGDGAFVLAGAKPADEYVLRRAAQPFALEATSPAHDVVFKVARSDTDAARMVEAGAADLAVPSNPATTTVALLLNRERATLQDARVRQAIAASLDLRDAAKTLSLAPAQFVAHTNSVSTTASSLLAQAGWACEPGACVNVVTQTTRSRAVVTVTQPLTLSLVVVADELPLTATAALIQNQLAGAGISASVQLTPVERLPGAGAFDAALLGLGPSARLSSALGCHRAPLPQGDVCDVVREAESGEGLIRAAKRDEIFRAANEALAAQAIVLPLYSVRAPVLSDNIANLKPAGRAPITWNLWQWRRT